MIRRNSVGLFACLVLLSMPSLSSAQDMRLFRIGTGGVGGTYYPVGSLIARAVSQPADPAACGEPGCGESSLVVVAQSANGSVANVRAIGDGVLESGFSQSDVAYWAFSHSGIFKGTEFYPNLRAIAGLYPETVHIVARRDSGIRSVDDLRGRRVSLDEPGSGTLVDARLVLSAYGLTENDLEPEYIKPTLASERIRTGQLDAFFIVAGHPVTSVQELARSTDVVIVPVDGPEREKLLNEYRFFSGQSIGAGVYRGVGETATISVHAIWVTRSDIEEDVVYAITRALWSDDSRRLLDNGHDKAREIDLTRALDGVAIPVHPGAERYYREQGLIP